MDKTLASQMRQAMRRLASGVSILSACDHLGAPMAITVSSVTSVSDAPASLLIGNVSHSYFSSSASKDLLLYLNGSYRQLSIDP